MKALAILFTILVTLPVALCGKEKNPLAVSSPDKSVTVQFILKDNGVPVYTIQRNGQTLIADSKLGFILKDKPSLTKDFKVVDSKRSSFDEIWTQPWGEVKSIRNQYNSLVITLEEQTALKRRLLVAFRVYNDGVGFRYEIPQQPNLSDFVIMDELTEFAFAQNLNAWWIPAYSEDMDSECLFRKNNP
jgi:alpha-glucosidase